MSSRNDRFNSAMVSLEDAIGKTGDKSRFVIMYGQYVSPEEMYAQLDGTDRETLKTAKEEAHNRALEEAKKRLRKLGRKHLVPTLELICLNGNNRHWSIEALQAKCKGGTEEQQHERARRMYNRHRAELLAIFTPTKH